METAIAQILTPHIKDLGGFEARRSLPHQARKMVGAFIFFDHLGAAEFPPGRGVDVRPHPHIHLATVTYLFEGSLMHRDSLGSVQKICPGAINWMNAGTGIVHSERSPEEDRPVANTLHAIQTWVALPKREEESDPTFDHYPAETIPHWEENGVEIGLISGKLGDKASPVQTKSNIFYLSLKFLPSGGSFTLDAQQPERGIYSVTEGITINGEALPQHRLAILKPGKEVTISAEKEARAMVIGGEPVGTRYKWWNFVSSSKERIQQAKQDWKARKFATVPEESEFIPLPDDESEQIM